MNEIEFRNWLATNGMNKKVISDYISRLKRIEREINPCDIDEQYRNDKCQYLMKLFIKMGDNEEMKKYPNTDLPIGKYHMSTFRLALKKYVEFLDNFNTNNFQIPND